MVLSLDINYVFDIYQCNFHKKLGVSCILVFVDIEHKYEVDSTGMGLCRLHNCIRVYSNIVLLMVRFLELRNFMFYKWIFNLGSTFVSTFCLSVTHQFAKCSISLFLSISLLLSYLLFLQLFLARIKIGSFSGGLP